MDKEDLKKSVCINLRCVTQSSKGGVPLNQLQNDYRQLLGTPIPFKDLGYSSLESFLWNIPDVICIKKKTDGSLIAEGVADASTAHIAKLISKQKSSKKSKSGSAKPAVVTRTWGSSGKTNFHQKIKTPLKDSNSFPPSTLDRNHGQNSKCIHLTPTQQELKKSVLINLRSVVQSCKDGVPLNRLQKDYRKFIGSNIPFENLGYSTLYEFIRSIPDVINLKMDANEQFIAIGVVDEATAHLFGTAVKPKLSKSMSQPTEPSVNDSAAHQISSKHKAESSFFKLPQNTVELSDLNSVLKHAQPKKKVRKKTQPIYSVYEMLSKNKMKHASKEELVKEEPLKAAKPIINCKENSTPVVSLSRTDIATSWNQNEIAKTIQDQIKVASLSPLVWMNFILYGPSNIETLRKKVLSFLGFPFSADSKEWKEKINLLSLLPKETLHQCLYLLRIEFDLKDSKKSLQDKLIDFLAAYTKESGINSRESVEEDNEKELYASTLTLSSTSSDVLSKYSYYADTEASDAVRSDRNFVFPKTKHKILSDSDSDFIEMPSDRRNLLPKSSCHLKKTKEPVQIEQPKVKGNSHAENCGGIRSEKMCEIKHPTSTKSSVQKQQPLDKNLVEQKIHVEECSKTETSNLVSSKSARNRKARNRRRKRKKAENAEKIIELSETKLAEGPLTMWQVKQMIKLKKEKRMEKSLLCSAVQTKLAT